ncbi:MAG: phosphatase PAP2 family protein [Lachnospiraceae bacterium]|nr:phosphatase PAP2 family protein [Lachnospiraceae bacterium]
MEAKSQDEKVVGSKWQNIIFGILPKYAFAPLILALVFNFIGYVGIQQLHEVLPLHDFSTVIDDHIPFISGFIIIYILAFVQWFLGFILCGRESREFCYRYLSAEIYAKLLCFICFLVIPSTIVRPEVNGDGIINWLVQFIYNSDHPINLFPSIHCLESWFCLRCAFSQKRTGNIYKVVTTVMTLLVFASVVCVKQHVFVDIIGAVVVFEIGMYIAGKIDLHRLYDSLENWWTKVLKVNND